MFRQLRLYLTDSNLGSMPGIQLLITLAGSFLGVFLAAYLTIQNETRKEKELLGALFAQSILQLEHLACKPLGTVFRIDENNRAVPIDLAPKPVPGLLNKLLEDSIYPRYLGQHVIHVHRFVGFWEQSIHQYELELSAEIAEIVGHRRAKLDDFADEDAQFVLRMGRALLRGNGEYILAVSHLLRIQQAYINGLYTEEEYLEMSERKAVRAQADILADEHSEKCPHSNQ